MKNLTILILSAVVAVLAYVSYTTTRWGGSYGYIQLEYELTFLDPNESPVEGVELRVEDQRGNELFCFPVTDCLPGQAPKSDRHGVLRFHHVETAVEWDNYGRMLFWCVAVPTTRSPVYVCRFLHGGREVHRVRYDDLPDWDWPDKGRDQVPMVKRMWNWSTMIPNEIQYRVDDTEESYNSRSKLFFNRKGEELWTREASIASRNARRLLRNLEQPHADKQDVIDVIEFPVIRRTIKIERRHD